MPRFWAKFSCRSEFAKNESVCDYRTYDATGPVLENGKYNRRPSLPKSMKPGGYVARNLSADRRAAEDRSLRVAGAARTLAGQPDRRS
jgi:hypothetical protein